ncbi:MAG: branched-chain amino acid ABC transporter permease, partial [Desulfitobacterium sp.]|nr:branched-chain amino acid ABC transporter permease [Desulfitobacterium sp.]
MKDWLQQIFTKKNLIIIAFLIVTYVISQFLISNRLVTNFIAMNLILVCINIILSTSLNLITGITGQLSIGHAGFMAIGAYFAAIVTVHFDGALPLSLIAGAIAAGIVGFLIGLPTLRLKGDYLAIATLGLGEIVRVVFLNIDYVGGASGFSVTKSVTWPWAFWLMVFSVLIIRNFQASTHGRACISIRENEIAAEAMGINS